MFGTSRARTKSNGIPTALRAAATSAPRHACLAARSGGAVNGLSFDDGLQAIWIDRFGEDVRIALSFRLDDQRMIVGVARQKHDPSGVAFFAKPGVRVYARPAAGTQIDVKNCHTAAERLFTERDQ